MAPYVVYNSYMQLIPIPEKLNERINIRLTKTEKKILASIAKNNKVSANLVIRYLIQSFIEK